jgi:hypothetical protein
MDLYLSLLSPVWWATVLVCTVALTAATSWLARGAARRSGPAQAARSISHRRMRLAAWTVVLLVLANLSMLCTMVAANLRTPNLAGPVGSPEPRLYFSPRPIEWEFVSAMPAEAEQRVLEALYGEDGTLEVPWFGPLGS